MDLYAAAPRTFLWPAAWLLSVGTVILAVAVWSIAGWHGVGVAGASLPPLRVQYDAAWAFAFAGASLMAASAQRRRLARAFAVIPIVLGALRLIASFAPGIVSARPLLSHPWLPYGA